MINGTTCNINGDFEINLRKKIEDDVRRSDFVTKVLPTLHKFGNVVIRVDNLPAKLTVHALNLMMGTYSLTSDQIVAIITSGKKGRELMNIRVVLHPDNKDIQRLLGKDKCKTAYNTNLLIKRTDLKELETFLHKNYDKIRNFDTGDNLPINIIGYGKT